MTTNMKPPIATKIPVEIITHGDKRVDNYSWLKDKSDPEVIKYLEEENKYAESFMADTKALQDRIYSEIIGRIKEDDTSCPYRRGGYLYYYKQEKGKNYVIHFRKKAEEDSEEEMILDENVIAEKLNYCSIEILPSPDNKILAYMVDSAGDFSFTVYFKNLETGELLNDVLKNAGVQEWSNDSKNVYYVIYKEGNRGKQAFVHTLSDKQENDKLLYQENDDKFWINIRKSASKKYIIIGTGYFTTSEEYYIEADGADTVLKLIEKREEGIKYVTEHHGEDFYFLTNCNALNFSVMKASVSDAGRENWTDFIPENKNVKIEEIYVFDKYFVVQERGNGLRKIRIIDLSNNQSHYVNFPESIYMVFIQDNYEFETQYLRFRYTSFTTPMSFYDHDMKNNNNILLKQTEVPGGYNKEDYVSERVFAPSHDGKLIPVSLVYKKGLEKNGSNPLFLYSYGAYGISSEIWFSPARLPLLERGFVFAVAHIRGGGELGEEWYKDGKLLNKKNTFYDFISCAEYLAGEKYTYRGGIAAMGASAGGTLVGTIANMKPDLFKCIIGKVPAVDVLNNLLDSSMDNSAAHFGELGNPDIKEHYEYLKSYSPYENIKEQQYPCILLTTGFNDANVPYWEPAKFTAKLREINKNKNFIILKINFDTGHWGPSERYSIYNELAYDNAFILKCFGIRE